MKWHFQNLQSRYHDTKIVYKKSWNVKKNRCKDEILDTPYINKVNFKIRKTKLKDESSMNLIFWNSKHLQIGPSYSVKYNRIYFQKKKVQLYSNLSKLWLLWICDEFLHVHGRQIHQEPLQILQCILQHQVNPAGVRLPLLQAYILISAALLSVVPFLAESFLGWEIGKYRVSYEAQFEVDRILDKLNFYFVSSWLLTVSSF